MAVDTVDKRLSLMSSVRLFVPTLPMPDGSFVTIPDRMHLLGVYYLSGVDPNTEPFSSAIADAVYYSSALADENHYGSTAADVTYYASTLTDEPGVNE